MQWSILVFQERARLKTDRTYFVSNAYTVRKLVTGRVKTQLKKSNKRANGIS